MITDFHEQDTDREIIIEATFLKEDSDTENFDDKGLNKWVDPDDLVKFKKIWSSVDQAANKKTFSVEEGEFVDGGFAGLETHPYKCNT